MHGLAPNNRAEKARTKGMGGTGGMGGVGGAGSAGSAGGGNGTCGTGGMGGMGSAGSAGGRNGKGGMGIAAKRNRAGWLFLLPASLLIAWMSFYPMVSALLLSLKTGVGANTAFAGLYNYRRLLRDTVFRQTLGTTLAYLVVQVPVMLVLALALASLLNDRKLKFKGLFRTAIFLPCATSLVSYSIIFRSLFAIDGYVNYVFVGLGIFSRPFNWFGDPLSARMIIVIALIWRWTGYNMVFYLASLQNIDSAIYESARIDGASAARQLVSITIPLLKPTILLTAIMSTNGTLQLFDESFNLTSGGPARASMTVSHYLYSLAFQNAPNIGYAAAVSYAILILVAILALIQMKVGDRR
jgi:lactose/L-arabinose transport system permease protein